MLRCGRTKCSGSRRKATQVSRTGTPVPAPIPALRRSGNACRRNIDPDVYARPWCKPIPHLGRRRRRRLSRQTRARGGTGDSVSSDPQRRFEGFPVPPFVPPSDNSERKRVIVTGCFDWFHSGHIRFFEEASTLGDLYVVVGHDANIKLLKGEGHPLISQQERLYMVQSVRCVSSGPDFKRARMDGRRTGSRPHQTSLLCRQ